MDIKTIRQNILESDEFVLEETKKLQYLYALKHEIRYNQQRTDTQPSESVAEHIYGMHILTNYFLALEDTDNTLNRADVYNTITWHDIDEVEAGDMLGQLKTEADRVREAEAMQVVLANLPDAMRPEAVRLLTSYESQSTPEARFVKAIDKIEPIFEIYHESYKPVLRKNQTTEEQHRRIKEPYIEKFPFMLRFHEVITRELVNEKYFINV